MENCAGYLIICRYSYNSDVLTCNKTNEQILIERRCNIDGALAYFQLFYRRQSNISPQILHSTATKLYAYLGETTIVLR